MRSFPEIQTLLRIINPSDYGHIAAIWNAACGADLSITPRFVEYNAQPATGAIQSGQLALENDQPVGFVLASALPGDSSVSLPQTGWIDAIAVLPNAQRQGIGSALIGWAEEWLRSQGCTEARLGGGLRPFVPGYPVELGGAAFFQKRSHIDIAPGTETWDVARDLADYAAMYGRAPTETHIRSAQPEDEKALLDFFFREFPGRWRYEFQEFLRERGRVSDYLLLLTARGIDGFVRITLEDSERPLDRFYMHRLPRPRGQLGPIGVSASVRGKGYGRALLDAALCQLRDGGVRGCVIDWTNLVDFYAKFGFKPYRRYAMLVKKLEPRL
jgi:GNAT superfamily N-acetyltransferase